MFERRVKMECCCFDSQRSPVHLNILKGALIFLDWNPLYRKKDECV